jgi:polysaccharide pyruvyl transferase WcaK-like protein
MIRTSKKIGLLQHLGGGNLGDDASLDAVLHNIKTRWPDAVIFGFSMNPDDTQNRHGIPCYAIRTETWSSGYKVVESRVSFKEKVRNALSEYHFLVRLLQAISAVTIRPARALLKEFVFLAKSFRIIRTLNVLVISGGGQLLDAWGGPWKFPYTLFKWVLLAKLSRVTCYFINVGAGPLDYPLGRWFIRCALLLADYVSFRDEDSRKLIQGIGFTGRSQVVADCVYSLDIPASVTSRGERREERIVGFSPMAYCDPRVYWKKDQYVYDKLIQNFTSFGSWLSRHHYRLALFTTDILFDSQTIEDVRAALEANNVDSHQIASEPIRAFDGLLSQLYSIDYVVTCRFHGVVFAHLLNKPVLAISHHPKVATLMNDLGLANYCVDIRSCDLSLLTETFISLVTNRDEIKISMAGKLVHYRRKLAIQFDDLFPKAAKI